MFFLINSKPNKTIKLNCHFNVNTIFFSSSDWFYVTRAAIIMALFAASAYLFTYSPSLWVCAASAVCLGLAWQQLAFVGHDIGHHVLSHNRNTDDNLGVVFGNFLQGKKFVFPFLNSNFINCDMMPVLVQITFYF